MGSFGSKARLNARRGSRREPDLTSLINIVFLILIFFIVAGTLRPFSARDIKLAKVAKEAAGSSVPSTLIVHQEGRISYAGQDVRLQDLADRVRGAGKRGDGKPFTIVADGRAPAPLVLKVSRALRTSGVTEIALMVERGRQ